MYLLRGIIPAPIVVQANSSYDPNNDNGDPTTEQIKSKNMTKRTESQLESQCKERDSETFLDA